VSWQVEEAQVQQCGMVIQRVVRKHRALDCRRSSCPFERAAGDYETTWRMASLVTKLSIA